MPRKATGQIIAPKGKQRSFAIRFTAYGKRRFVTLGRPEEGWNRQRAEAELRHVLADVERGIWRPVERAPRHEVRDEPTFHEFASEWLQNREPELRPKTLASYRWQLSGHLLPFFAEFRLSEIKPRDLDRYKADALRRAQLGPNQINKTLGLLGRILKAARRYGLLQSNPLDDVDRLKQTRPSRATIEPEQLPALLATGGAIRPLIATMAGAGLRNGEACALDWCDVNLAAGVLAIRAAKTDAGSRQVDLPLALREELSAHKARSRPRGSRDPVFPNRNGARQTVSNVERRLKTAIKRANARLDELGIEAVREAVTPHSMRRLLRVASLRTSRRPGLRRRADGPRGRRVFDARVCPGREAARAAPRTRARGVRSSADWAEMGRIAPERLEERAMAPDPPQGFRSG